MKKKNNDSLGDRMKDYENRLRYYTARKAHVVIRCDGRCFHSFTRGFKRPYDLDLITAMNMTAKYLCENISGAKFAFVQSDEISVVVTDFDTIYTEAWFNGNVQKITSISASLATAKFNEQVQALGIKKLATFDSRVFVLPNTTEVVNYAHWRQTDTTRNSIQMAARAMFSHKECDNKTCDELQEMLWQKHNINWNDYPVFFKRGRMVVKRESSVPVTYTHKKTGELITLPEVCRSEWVIEEPPIFTQDRDYILNLLPKLEQ